MDQELMRLGAVFMPHATAAYARIRAPNGPDFVHYTSAENLLKILGQEVPEVWMRNARCMNDVSEVYHGYDRIEDVLLKDGRNDRLKNALEAISPELAEQALNLFRGHIPNIIAQTYITCISEHPRSEENYGRLSMWRAYSQGSIGTAIVFNKAPFLTPSDALSAYTSPVAYHTEEELAKEIDTIIFNINRELAWLKARNPKIVETFIFNMFLFGITCLKHPGFKEELEWRILHHPSLGGKNPLKSSKQVVGGVPQKVFRIPLQDIPGPDGLDGISPDKLIKRVIIGPSNYPQTVREAIIEALEDAGVSNAAQRVVVSDIPLRTTL